MLLMKGFLMIMPLNLRRCDYNDFSSGISLLKSHTCADHPADCATVDNVEPADAAFP